MTMARTMVAVVAMAFGLAGAASAAEHKAEGGGKKSPVTCKQIVETYKVNNSVDMTADALLVDQSIVAACLKDAGIKAPTESDR